MAEKKWEIQLPDGFAILVRKETFFGKWIAFSIVLALDGECIARYDNAHGTPHQDLIGKENGWLRRENCSQLGLQGAFEHALRDFKANYKEHYAFFNAN